MNNRVEVSEKLVMHKHEEVMKNIGTNIRKERLGHGMSRVDLAYFARTTESMICTIENGKKMGISIYTLVKISEALEININSLFL